MRQKRLRKGIVAAAFTFLVFCSISDAYGSGFGIYTQGASALGQGNSTIAHTDDPTAIFLNPALINTLEGTQIEFGTTLLFPSREFKSDLTGDTHKAKSAVFYPSTFFITHKYNEKISTGLGVFNPFGLGNEWGDDWEGRYITTNAEMQTFNINPVVSYQVTPNISFAVGLDYLLLDAILENNNCTNPPVCTRVADIEQKFDGDGDGFGYNLGILFDLNKDVSIGASYRSEIEVDVDGDAAFDLPAGIPSAFFPNTDAKTDITLPQQVHAGISYKGIDLLTLEVGLRWEGWSSFDRLKIDLDEAVGIPPTNVLDTPKDWEDTYSVNLGGRYQLNDTVALLAGYLYGENPIPDDTFEPMIPDSDSHIFTIGTDIRYNKFKIDLAYSYQILESREVSNSPIAFNPDGEYNTNFHILGLSLTYTFL